MKKKHKFLRNRRSIRRFKPDPIPALVVDRILDTARYAPSAHHLQPWRFALIQSEAAKKNLGAALTGKMSADMAAEGIAQAEIRARTERSLRRIDEAPLIILLCRDMTILRENKPQDQQMSIQSVALAGLQLMLAAHAEGLGANWICWALYAQAETQEALGLPENWLPEAIFFIGYPDETPKEKTLKPVEEIVRYF